MPRPLRLGHRGARASHHVPENTLASFELCLDHGCDGFEFDVRRSVDGVAVVCHDPTAGGLKIDATPATRLALPTLDQVLQQFSSRAFLDIELKVPGLESQTVATIREHPPTKGYVVSSFQPKVLSAVRSRDPLIPLGLLWERQGPMTLSDPSFDWLIPHFRLVEQSLIAQAHAVGRKVIVWTANDANRMRELAARGVDAIISDETELLVKTLG
jgi:glycerophosphoryl diester phosphodiesterase